MIVYGQIKSSAKKVRKSRKNPAKLTQREVKTFKPSPTFVPRGNLNSTINIVN